MTLRVAELERTPDSADHEATWLLGHTERISFGRLERRGGFLQVRARLSVPCRFLVEGQSGQASCSAHGFNGAVPASRLRREARQLGGDRFDVVQGGRRRSLRLGHTARREGLPVVAGPNPCAGARCRTADNRIGAACCRDLQVAILCPPSDRRLEALVRSRRSPFVCKVERESPDILEVEVISACSYLAADGVACALHDRWRPDGRRAKPDLCSDWPTPADTLHPGCVFAAGAGPTRGHPEALGGTIKSA